MYNVSNIYYLTTKFYIKSIFSQKYFKINIFYIFFYTETILFNNFVILDLLLKQNNKKQCI
jgi:hypothetical protein